MSSSHKRARPSECNTTGFFNNCQFNSTIDLLQTIPPRTEATASNRFLPQGRPLFGPPLLAAPSSLQLPRVPRPKPHVHRPPNRDVISKKAPMKPLGPAPTLMYMSFESQPPSHMRQTNSLSQPTSHMRQTNSLSFENSFQNMKKRKYCSDTGLERRNCTLSNDEEVFVEAAAKLARENERQRSSSDELHFSRERFLNFHSEHPVVTSRNYR